MSGGTRTHGILLPKQAHFQLCYAHISKPVFVATTYTSDGFEPSSPEASPIMLGGICTRQTKGKQGGQRPNNKIFARVAVLKLWRCHQHRQYKLTMTAVFMSRERSFYNDAGAGDRSRTRNPRSTKPMLYQLSYTSVHPRLSEVSAPCTSEQIGNGQTRTGDTPQSWGCSYLLSYTTINALRP